MASKNIKVYYYYPIVKETNLIGKEEIKVVGIETILKALESISLENRVVKIGEDNIQLKIINKNSEDRWELGFLRNTKDTYFKSRLDESVLCAETLDEDEFVGQECCMIYDEKSRLVALQSNAKSISYSSLATFFNQFIQERIQFIPVTLKEKYSNISDEKGIDYRSVVINFVDIDEINRIAKEESNEAVLALGNISNDLGAITGKVELGVGRSKYKFLNKEKLKRIVEFFKKYPTLAKGLKVKVFENDSIRLIDLIENKVCNDISISIAKDDPKTFDKILNPMNDYIDTVIKEDLDKCNVLMKGNTIEFQECLNV